MLDDDVACELDTDFGSRYGGVNSTVGRESVLCVEKQKEKHRSAHKYITILSWENLYKVA